MDAVKLSAYGDSEALRALGESLREDRLGRNFTQQHLASLAGISLPTYRKVEQGDGSLEIRHFARVLAILGHIERLREVVPPPSVPIDRRALVSLQRQRARSPAAKSKP